ncbi:MAG: sigma-54-dependent Fis family transcriptional regulator, partial [Deltaproteobacteria bacterium]|nr:sigma-54-dependent Fis family transcriptional regulator [Deltaproteobacteria bacterium]
LFGYEKGAFTGAGRRQRGKFEESHGGTIFLDEIGDMSLNTQAKILRVLEEKSFTRLGSSRGIPVDVRIIAATNKNLEEEIRAGNFRQDLFYRLNVLPIEVPPLRRRREDIPLLAEHFLAGYFSRHGGRVKHLSPEVLELLQRYQWPGNVRELKNLMERLAIMCASELIQILDLPPYLRQGADSANPEKQCWHELLAAKSLAEATRGFEKIFLTGKLQENDWNISKTASEIGTTRRSLHRKINSLTIRQP